MYKVVGIIIISVFLCYSEVYAKIYNTYELLGYAKHKGANNGELFLAIDKTFKPDNNIKSTLIDKVLRWIDYGKYIEVYEFSSATNGSYMWMTESGGVENQPKEDFLNNLRRSDLNKFNYFHNNQKVVVVNAIVKAVNECYKRQSSQILYSDIFMAMKELSVHMKILKSKKKILFIMSDMLENSSITSFYRNGKIRLIDVEEELRKARRSKMLANFGPNVSVYVIGLSYFENNLVKDKYIEPQKIQRLKEFWRRYFIESGCKSVTIGSPMMFDEIK